MVKIRRIESIREMRKLRVAAYARVSTGKNDQLESYETQVAFYMQFIAGNPDWEYVGVYADPGKSATNAEHRPEFQRMIADAYAGKIDVIYCKEISRFARNIVDAQRYAHELKERDVEVRFHTENISTFDPSAELMFSIKAMFAQEESHNTSEKVRWGYIQRAKQGIRRIGNNRVLGYDEVDGVLTPNEDAWIVKLIFESYANGMAEAAIIRLLTEKGARRQRSERPFNVSAIQAILRNSDYTGDRLLQKQPPKNYLTKRPDITIPYESYYIENNHVAIVDRVTWSMVQERIRANTDARMEGIHRRNVNHPLYGKLFCAYCGSPYTRRTVQRKDGLKKMWMCAERRKGQKGNGCQGAFICEDELLTIIAKRLDEDFTCGEEKLASLLNDVVRIDVQMNGGVKVRRRQMA